MNRILNRKRQLSAFVGATFAFIGLLRWASPEVLAGAMVVVMAGLALVSPDDARKNARALESPGDSER